MRKVQDEVQITQRAEANPFGAQVHDSGRGVGVEPGQRRQSAHIGVIDVDQTSGEGARDVWATYADRPRLSRVASDQLSCLLTLRCLLAGGKETRIVSSRHPLRIFLADRDRVDRTRQRHGSERQDVDGPENATGRSTGRCSGERADTEERVRDRPIAPSSASCAEARVKKRRPRAHAPGHECEPGPPRRE